MTDYIKRIQSALGRKVKVSRTQIKEYLASNNIDANNPTEEQIEAVKLYFLSDLDLSEANSLDNAIEISDNKAVLEVVNQEPSEDSTAKAAIAQSSTEETLSIDNALTINPEVRDMVNFKAGSMGIAIAENQIDLIASQIDATGNSFSETISAIENALIEYIDYQHSEESYQIESMMTRVISRVASKNEAINQQLSSGISDFTQNLQDLEISQKKRAGNILSRLKVPV
ncbi:hypothetical protein [uncultured Nostoc sp.]|uniref:hypothetical protein n=1 Tax=uncultured Nostoc sp. TaxID=340711 RepID=UPI0035CA7C20